MNKYSIVIIFLFLVTTFLSCEKESVSSKFTYNQKANELIQQVLIDESCECFLQIPDTSMLIFRSKEDPIQDIRKEVIKKLHLRDSIELDSLDYLSNNFILNNTNRRVIQRNSFRASLKDLSLLKTCPNGVLSILKPIFDKDYKNAIIDYGYTSVCIPAPISVYKFENGKWQRLKTQ